MNWWSSCHSNNQMTFSNNSGLILVLFNFLNFRVDIIVIIIDSFSLQFWLAELHYMNHGFNNITKLLRFLRHDFMYLCVYQLSNKKGYHYHYVSGGSPVVSLKWMRYSMMLVLLTFTAVLRIFVGVTTMLLMGDWFML